MQSKFEFQVYFTLSLSFISILNLSLGFSSSSSLNSGSSLSFSSSVSFRSSFSFPVSIVIISVAYFLGHRRLSKTYFFDTFGRFSRGFSISEVDGPLGRRPFPQGNKLFSSSQIERYFFIYPILIFPWTFIR